MKYYTPGGRALSSAIAQGLVVAMVILGSLAVAPQAHATNNHSGTVCKNYNAGEANLIDYFVNGTRSVGFSATAVICPLIRTMSTRNGAVVFVDITHIGRQTTSCTAYSHTYKGRFLASASETWTGTGFHSFILDLTGNRNSGLYSDYSVLCTIPGNANGLLHDIDLSE